MHMCMYMLHVMAVRAAAKAADWEAAGRGRRRRWRRPGSDGDGDCVATEVATRAVVSEASGRGQQRRRWAWRRRGEGGCDEGGRRLDGSGGEGGDDGGGGDDRGGGDGGNDEGDGLGGGGEGDCVGGAGRGRRWLGGGNEGDGLKKEARCLSSRDSPRMRLLTFKIDSRFRLSVRYYYLRCSVLLVRGVSCLSVVSVVCLCQQFLGQTRQSHAPRHSGTEGRSHQAKACQPLRASFTSRSDHG